MSSTSKVIGIVLASVLFAAWLIAVGMGFFLVTHLPVREGVQPAILMEELAPNSSVMPEVLPPAEIHNAGPEGNLRVPDEDYILVVLASQRVGFFRGGRDGEMVKAWDILSFRDFGKFATPTGSFEALTKEENHFSSIGKVWMPYSVQFHGDYFIHGWPYYPGGEPVPQGYSGGCVRLSVEDAKELYALIKVGMPILVVK